jgi:hypothetical protein
LEHLFKFAGSQFRIESSVNLSSNELDFPRYNSH